MASKLTSSLRKSISAEKQSVEDKQAGIEEVAVIKPKAVAAKPAPAKPATPRRAAAPRAPKAVVPPVKAVEVAPIEAKKAPVPVKKPQPEVVTNSATLLVSPNLDSIKVMLEKISTSNQELSNSFVESIVGINQDVTTYLQQISDVKNLVNIQEVNEKFIASLRQRQQELINKNLELFGQFKFF